MTRDRLTWFSLWIVLIGLSPFIAGSRAISEEPSPKAVSAFNSYVAVLEARLAQQHQSSEAFLAGVRDSDRRSRLRRGEMILERLTPSDVQPPGAMLHYWRGTAFAPDVRASDFEKAMKDFNTYPQNYAPEVLKAVVVGQHQNRFRTQMRLRQHHVVTVVLDATYDITFARLDLGHGYSASRSVRIVEIDSAGTKAEHELNADQEHGFLWRSNTYWSYEERDGGLYLQIESVSLTRAIPLGLAWAVRPFVESVPRESMEFTLRSTCAALRKHP
jgi:hypothetical protein